LTRSDLEAWLDGFLPYALAHGEIAGAVVAVVKDDQVLLEKGYGYADIANKTPVDPERTLFRFGSVSKLFTWTAVMQLVEQGKLDLDRDLNGYLDFQIRPAFGQGVTLRNLMTHTAGFEEHFHDMLLDNPNRLPSLETFVKSNQPKRIYPPGKIPAYSNYGAALAGYIVQRVSGEPFPDYIERHILRPLAMQHSTFRQPLPPSLSGELSNGYPSTSQPPAPFEVCGPVPAGALSATASDAARFMMAHLDETQSGLLQPQTLRMMHGSIFQAIPPLNGMSLGFFQTDRNGRRIISHGGDTVVFHSDMELLVDEHVGFFISLNSRGQDAAAYRVITAVFEQFMDRYFPDPIPHEPTAPTAIEHAQSLARAGHFHDSRRSASSFLSLTGLFDQQTISANPDATISLASATRVDGQPKIWREVAPYLWREANGKERLAATVSGGSVGLLGTDSTASSGPLQPVPVWSSAAWNLPFLIFAVVVDVLTVVFWALGAALRRRYRTKLPLTGSELTPYQNARLATAIGLLFWVGWLLIFAAGLSDLALFSGPLRPWIRLVQFVGLFALSSTVVVFWNFWLTLRGSRPLRTKLWSFAMAASALALVWFAIAFHLLSATLSY